MNYCVQHKYYCGVDLHARSMYLCILDQEGKVLVHKDLPTDADRFLEVVAPYMEDLVVAVECMFSWYWLADVCQDNGIKFVLGHALYMRAIHGGKAKNDRIDSYKIACLLRGGMIPMAYVYPRKLRATRDLLRRRMYFTRHRAELIAHIRNTSTQYNLDEIEGRLDRSGNWPGVAEHFPAEDVRKSVEADLTMIAHMTQLQGELEWYLEKTARAHDYQSFALLQSVPGIGTIIGLVILYEIDTIERFGRVQQFLSYGRLVKCAHESAGKIRGTGGNKIGNAYLKWAFSEAAVLFLRGNERAQKYVKRLESKHGKGKSLSILAARLARAVYYMLKRKEAFQMDRFFAA